MEEIRSPISLVSVEFEIFGKVQGMLDYGSLVK
jgi:hypothetical protein